VITGSLLCDELRKKSTTPVYRRRRSIAGAIFRRTSEDRPVAPGSRVIAPLLAARAMRARGIEQESGGV
jgi:hypothetical protein